MKDQGELRMFDLFAEAVEDLYTGIIDKYVGRRHQLFGKNLLRDFLQIFFLWAVQCSEESKIYLSLVYLGGGPIIFPMKMFLFDAFRLLSMKECL